MKKLTIFVVALILLALCACGGNTQTPPETTVATEPKVKTDVAEPLTWEKILAIPVANDDMTEEELRQICLDALRLQLTFGWTPSEQTYYHNSMYEKTFYPGKVYGGIPYNSRCFGNIYKWMYFYDEENGMLDLSGGDATLAKICNQCTGGTLTGWSRVVNSADYYGTNEMTHNAGCLRVGPYTYADTIMGFGQRDTYTICADNGAVTMWESYAALKPADGIVNYSNYEKNGHVRMVVSVDVVRFEDGKVNGMASTLTYMDQWAIYHEETQSNGIPYEVEGGVDVVMTFQQVYDDGYLPFTFAELNKENPVEKAEVSITVGGDSVKLSELTRAQIECNYIISDISVSVTDADGKEVYHKDTIISHMLMPKTTLLNTAVSAKDLGAYADGNHTITISTWVNTGEKLVAYSGLLTN